MFKAYELGQSMSREEFDAAMPDLRTRLLKAQFALKKTKRSFTILVHGLDGAGKGDVVNFLHELLDPRDVRVVTWWDETEEERERPSYWRFWREMPRRGQIAFFFGAWYADPLTQYVSGKLNHDDFQLALRRISRFERMHAEDCHIVMKFWLHISKKTQEKRFQKLESTNSKLKDAAKRAWWHYDKYDDILRAAEETIRTTDAPHSRWYLVEADDRRHRDMTILRTVVASLESLVAATGTSCVSEAAVAGTVKDAIPNVLGTVDLTKTVERAEYSKREAELQEKLRELSWKAYRKKVSTVALFEGWDAAGKGGAIRRISSALDARLGQIISIAAPSDEEKSHHYLWRFWRHIPRAGYVTLYDRSWYGRVLVERVEQFAAENEWARAYREINDFEAQLVESGIVVLKFWLHISPEEQLRRFKEREEIPWKQHKITEEDWRNREKLGDYVPAVNEMLARTWTDAAPWVLVPAEDKRYARITVLESLVSALEKGVK